MCNAFRVFGTSALFLWVACLTPLPSVAADYTVRFGELRGPVDQRTVAPTRNIKFCVDSTGYGFGYEVVPQIGGSYEYYTIFHIPAPVQTLKLKTSEVRAGGREIKTAPARASGRKVVGFRFSPGDPEGDWRIEIFVNSKLIDTISFKVAPAATCP